jgi:predicted nucleic acid-binding protein
VGRPDKVESALLDASSLLGVVTGEPAFACLKSLLAAVDRGEVRLVESTAILVEVRPHYEDDGAENARVREDLLALLQSRRTQLVDVNTVVARKAGQLAADLGLKTWDAVHLATAILAGVDVLVVRDHRFPEGDYEGVWVTGPFDLDDDKIPGLLVEPGDS